jgi:hypothetical protein
MYDCAIVAVLDEDGGLPNPMETPVPNRPLLTQARLKELLSYDPETGIFRRLTKSYGSPGNIGDPVGGYRERDDAMYYTLDGRQHFLHNLAWLYVHGEFPAKQLLRRDGDGRNNALANLMFPVVIARDELTQERPKEVLIYDPEAGTFTWRIRASKKYARGEQAGTIDSTGRRYIGIDGADFLAARLAWFYVHGKWPDRYLRMKNDDHRDIRIDNLVEGVFLPTQFDHYTPEGRAEYQRAFRATHPDHVKSRDLLKDFGIDLTAYQAMFVAQKGVCAICALPERDTHTGKIKALAVDHHHETGAIRGLLCSACNTGIGKFGDDPTRLHAAAAYIERFAEAIDPNVIPLNARGRKT